MNKEQEAVELFHKTFEQPIETTPLVPNEKSCELRVTLIQEELDELETAFLNKDIVEVADALGDLLYVVYGAGVVCGIDLENVFNEVHRSNMTKVGGHKREDGKWVKPDTYEPANIKKVLGV